MLIRFVGHRSQSSIGYARTVLEFSGSGYSRPRHYTCVSTAKMRRDPWPGKSFCRFYGNRTRNLTNGNPRRFSSNLPGSVRQNDFTRGVSLRRRENSGIPGVVTATLTRSRCSGFCWPKTGRPNVETDAVRR